jgi:hypothetical protein
LSRIIHAVGCLASAIPYLILVAVLTRSWLDPMSVDEGAWVPLAVGLMALEFILLHSGVFMGTVAFQAKSVARRYGLFALLAGFYGIFAVAFSLVTGSWEVVEIFGFLMAGRLVTLMVATGEGKQQLIARSAAGIATYIPIVFLTVFVPFPKLGVTAAVLSEVYPDRGGGIWEQHPERAIAGAILYFGVMGLFELWQLARLPGGVPVATGAEGPDFGHRR